MHSPSEIIPELILSAVAAAKGHRTIAEIASTSKCEGHLSQVTQWKRQLLEAVREVFPPSAAKPATICPRMCLLYVRSGAGGGDHLCSHVPRLAIRVASLPRLVLSSP